MSEVDEPRFYRTLIRVETTDEADEIAVTVPSWNPYFPVRIWAATIPPVFRKSRYLLCQVNIGAENSGDLRFVGPWEVAPDPGSDDDFLADAAAMDKGNSK